MEREEYLEIFKHLRDDYSDDLPAEIIHSHSSNNKYKCRNGFYNTLFLRIGSCADMGLLDEATIKKTKEIKKCFGPVSPYGSYMEFMRRRKTSDDIGLANALLKVVIDDLESRINSGEEVK